MLTSIWSAWSEFILYLVKDPNFRKAREIIRSRSLSFLPNDIITAYIVLRMKHASLPTGKTDKTYYIPNHIVKSRD